MMNIKIRKRIGVILAILFILFSVVFINLEKPRSNSLFRSSQLEKRITKNSNTTRIEYVDKNGTITIAADMGYAIKTITQTEDGEFEEYFDNNDEPIYLYSGYCGKLNIYDTSGLKCKITFLDDKRNPVITLSGYATEVIHYNSTKQISAIHYFDTENQPIQTAQFGYGKTYEYNEAGKVSTITYIDALNKPMKTKLGYAIMRRTFYTLDDINKGRVKCEFYYDESYEPVALDLGQYGIQIAYNEQGQESEITYLDSKGEPLTTNRGYTKVVRTFHSDGSTATEKYYDKTSQPYQLSEGQYGIKKESGRIVAYTDQKGHTIINIKNILYNHSWLVVVLALIIVCCSLHSKERWNYAYFLVYLGVIVYFTVLFRNSEGTGLNLGLFWSYSKFFTDSSIRSEIIRNIWLFIPMGTILFRIKPNKFMLLISILLSVFIESLQLISNVGLCEIDDIVSNSLGGYIGFEFGRIIPCFMDTVKKKEI